MRYHVIKNKDLAPQQQDNYIPAEWPMYLTAMPDSEVFQGGLGSVMALEEVTALKNDLWDEYARLQAEKADFLSTRKLRIYDYVAYEYKNLSPSKLDFTMHLQVGVCLNKRDVVMTKAGRPTSATYYLGNLKIAQITFSFEVDSLNFVTRAKRNLGYFAVDDQVHATYLIDDYTLDGNINYQHLKQLEERTQARQWIIDSLRSDIDKMLSIAATIAPSQSSALGAMINAFWVDYNSYMSAFINSGGTFLRAKFAADTVYPFLNSFVAPGVTVRMYIVDKLTY